jgi:hypothetical protein
MVDNDTVIIDPCARWSASVAVLMSRKVGADTDEFPWTSSVPQ